MIQESTLETKVVKSYLHIMEKSPLHYSSAIVFKEGRKSIYWELKGDSTTHLVTEKNADKYLKIRTQKPKTAIYFDKEYEVLERLVYEGFFNI